jgi:uncharacterized membrane protein
MTILMVGILLWVVVHLVPSVAPPLKKSLLDKFGPKSYRGVFTLAIFASLTLIVLGWRATPEEYLYVLPQWATIAGVILMIAAFILIGAAQYPSLIRRHLRHPMLTGVALWAASHLLTNGTTRALVLFGGLGLWALIEILLINKRDGAFIKPEAPGYGAELKGVFISGIIFIVVLLLHPYFAGVTPLSR